ncbi:MAG: hypothetical protein IT438_16425 [Phycisphaerales bacterium]|nr:hypothetical protein [Phycisphaerales bacterium]
MLRIILAAIIALLVGCASGGSSTSGSPGVIVVHNTSGQNFESIEMVAASQTPGVRGRVGQLSPVLNGFEYEVARAPGAPPLPGKVLVRITMPDGRGWERVASVPRPGPRGRIIVNLDRDMNLSMTGE